MVLRSAGSFSRYIYIFVVLFAGLVLVGWIMDIALLKSVLPSILLLVNGPLLAVVIKRSNRSLEQVKMEQIQTEAVLRQSEARVSRLVESNIIGIITGDFSG